jgi:antitoxin FitA
MLMGVLMEGGIAMPDILVRGVDAETVRRLKDRANQHGRSLQSEVKTLIERAAGSGSEQIAAILKRWEERFAGRKFSSSARLIREDRKR